MDVLWVPYLDLGGSGVEEGVEEGKSNSIAMSSLPSQQQPPTQQPVSYRRTMGVVVPYNAVSGDSIPVLTPEGDQITVIVPPGTAGGSIMNIEY